MDCWWIDETPPKPGDQEWPKSTRIVIPQNDISKYYLGKAFNLDNYSCRNDVSTPDKHGVIVEIGIESDFLGVKRETYLIVEYL